MTPTRPVRSFAAARHLPLAVFLTAAAVFGCGCASSGPDPASGSSSGGASASGGATGSGGTSATGGASATGGRVGTGGAPGPGSGGSPPGGTGGVASTGGSTVSGSGGDATGTGGAPASGGRPGGGGTAGGGAAGRAGTGAAGRMGTGSGGSAGSGTAGRAGSSGAAGGDTGAGGRSGATMSAGCGKTRSLQNGTITITVANAARKYILRVPDGYDSSRPYRLVMAYAWSGASASQVVSANYFRFATLDTGKTTIFAAPDAANGAGSWTNADIAFTDAVLAQIEGDLCIDTSRVFASGFSFGGGMAMALACTRADVFRAVAFFSGADLTNSCPAMLTKPIAYYASQASEDSGGMPATSAITGEKKQAEFAAINGCTAVPASTTFPASGQPHTCTIYKGCSAGHPTEYCVFNGAHGWEPKDPGQSTSWDAPEAWKFITQF